MELTLIVLIVWIFSTCLHEFGHAITAYVAGDKSVKDRGYLTLNPIVYFHSATTLVIPLVVLLIGGIPLPGAAVYINQNQIKSRVWLSLVSFAGPMATGMFLLLLALFLNAGMPWLTTTVHDVKTLSIVYASTCFLIFLHIFVLVLNLLPLPPLDGYGIIEPWLPRHVQNKIREYSNVGFALLFALFFLCDWFSAFMTDISFIGSYLLGVDPKGIMSAYKVFRENSIPLAIFLVVVWIIRGRFASPLEKADKHLGKGEYREAIEQYELALAKNPKDQRATIALASCQLGSGNTDKALELADRALELNGSDVRAKALKAACLSDQGKPEAALATLANVQEAEIDFAFPFLVKCTALMSVGKHDTALATIDKGLKLEPTSVEALYQRGQCLEELRRYEDALSTYDRMARSREGHLRACLSKGLLLSALGRSEEAEKEYEKILPRQPEQRADETANLVSLLREKAQRLSAKNEQRMADNLAAAIDKLVTRNPQ